ncbi:hypothetical protein CDV50_03345 [Haematobacter massiliensis]|nr:hypothetical protein CDV50_03345 [Haematobacter massiliensis]
MPLQVMPERPGFPDAQASTQGGFPAGGTFLLLDGFCPEEADRGADGAAFRAPAHLRHWRIRHSFASCGGGVFSSAGQGAR